MLYRSSIEAGNIYWLKRC